MSALRLQWISTPSEDRVELPFLAAYILHQSEIGVDGSGLLTGNVLSREAISILTRYMPGADLNGKLAAAHFNVPPDEAFQVLLGGRFSEALVAGNDDALKELRRSENFWIVFERFSRSQLSAWQQPETLVRVVQFLKRSEIESASQAEVQQSIARVWSTVLSAALTIPSWGEVVDALQLEAFPTLLQRSGPASQDYTKLAQGMLRYFNSRTTVLNGSNPAKDRINLWVDVMRNTISELRSQPALLKTFQLSVGNQLFLLAAGADLRERRTPIVLDYLQCMSPAEVPKVLATLLPTTSEQDFLDLQTALVGRLTVDWDQFDAAISGTLATLPASTAVAAVRAVLRPRAGRDNVDSLLTQIGATVLEKLGTSGFEAAAQWREAGVLAAAGMLPSPTNLTDPAKSTRTRLETNLPAEILVPMADALSEFQLISKVLTAEFFALQSASALVNTLIDTGRFDELSPKDVVSRYPKMTPQLQAKVIQSATASPKFLQSMGDSSIDVFGVDQHDFLMTLLPALEHKARELTALRLAHLNSELPMTASSIGLLNLLADTCGLAWLPLHVASGFLKAMQSDRSQKPPEFESLKSHLDNRIALGDRTVKELFDSAEKAPPSERDELLNFAIDRARANFAAPNYDRNEALLEWGDALLARSRRGPWSSAKAYVERARELFEEGGRA